MRTIRWIKNINTPLEWTWLALFLFLCIVGVVNYVDQIAMAGYVQGEYQGE